MTSPSIANPPTCDGVLAHLGQGDFTQLSLVFMAIDALLDSFGARA
jgi:hypothetical protein